ncbi:LAETG motif-containing sortase-dependent surface protein [Streptomyces sp. NPDC002004]
MSISRRTASSVRFLGVASAAAALTLGVANTALACNIRDFTAVASCDNGKGVISVTDKDASGTPATITLYAKMTVPGEEDRLIGTQTIDHPTGEGVTITFDEDWAPEAQYRVHVKASNRVDEDIKPLLTAPSEGCSKESTPPASTTPTSPAPSSKPSEKPSEKPTPSASESTTPAPGGGNSATPSGGHEDLAETGADSNTGLIAGIAAALVAAGGAVVFALRKRGAAGTR